MRNLFIAAATFFLASSAFASSVSVQGRNYTSACGYFSGRYGDLVVTYQNDSLPWGVIVELIGGTEGSTVTGGGDNVQRVRYEWRDESRQVINASGSYQWSGEVSVTLTQRSSPSFGDGYDFVFRIIYPDGKIEFDNGTDSPWGFYRTHFGYLGDCIETAADKPDYAPMDVDTLSRW